MLSLFNLLAHYGLASEEVKLVRHTSKHIDITATMKADIGKLTEYTAWQPSGKFGNAKYLVMFTAEIGTSALFLGVWQIDGVIPNSELSLADKAMLGQYDFPGEWVDAWGQSSDRYRLQYLPIMSDLSERLLIDWESGTLAWVQNKDKQILEIRPPKLLAGFVSYDKTSLMFGELKAIYEHPQSNLGWVNALSAVKGVYLIKYNLDGRLYVGSASGANGIWGRWSDYVRTQTGGNKMLVGLDANAFEFSILEICPDSMSGSEINHRENRWKQRLGTWAFGLNTLEVESH